VEVYQQIGGGGYRGEGGRGEANMSSEVYNTHEWKRHSSNVTFSLSSCNLLLLSHCSIRRSIKLIWRSFHRLLLTHQPRSIVHSPSMFIASDQYVRGRFIRTGLIRPLPQFSLWNHGGLGGGGRCYRSLGGESMGL